MSTVCDAWVGEGGEGGSGEGGRETQGVARSMHRMHCDTFPAICIAILLFIISIHLE